MSTPRIQRADDLLHKIGPTERQRDVKATSVTSPGPMTHTLDPPQATGRGAAPRRAPTP
jgi:hypothetical protein